MWVEPAGAALRRAGRDRGRLRRRRRRRRRVDEPGADGHECRHRRPALRADDDATLRRAEPVWRRRARAAGHLGGDHRGEVAALARGARRVLGRLATKGRRRDPERLVQERDRTRRGAPPRRQPRRHHHRRRHPARQLAREAHEPEARLQGRRRHHRRQLEPAHRRRRGGARDGEALPSTSASGRAPASTRSRSAASTRSSC